MRGPNHEDAAVPELRADIVHRLDDGGRGVPPLSNGARQGTGDVHSDAAAETEGAEVSLPDDERCVVCGWYFPARKGYCDWCGWRSGK